MVWRKLAKELSISNYKLITSFLEIIFTQLLFIGNKWSLPQNDSQSGNTVII